MDFIEIKCPSCGGKLTIQSKDSKLYTCQYCGNQFMIKEEKGPQNIVNNYTIYHRTPRHFTGLRILAALFIPVIILMFLISGSINRRRTVNTYYDTQHLVRTISTEPTERSIEVPAPPAYSELYKYIVETIFEKPADDVGKEELFRIKYLKIEKDMDTSTVFYSFDDPYQAESFQINTLQLPPIDWDNQDITNFSGLVKLDLGYRLKPDTDITQLADLKGLVCNDMNFLQIAGIVSNPADFIELSVKSAPSMEGLPSFENLEILTLKAAPADGLKAATALKKLKSLSVIDYGSNDYSPISVMSSLESLYLSSENLKDISFIKELPELKEFTLENSDVFSAEPLGDCETITSLTLKENNTLLDLQPVGTLKGLKKLVIDKSTSQPDPDLSSLTELEELEISGFMTLTPLRSMQALKELSIHNCNVDEAIVLSSLKNVEKLSFYSIWTSQSQPKNLDFISGMNNLKYADFTGNRAESDWLGFEYQLTVYGDISPLFNHPGLEELYLDNGTFEIKFDQIKENSALKVLALRKLSLKKDFYVESNNGMTNVWYDDVRLSEHLDFFSKFPNLEELYLDENSLTDISFVSAIPMLSKLSIRNNYVTDLTPLIPSEHLSYLDVSDNPLSNMGGLDDAVLIIQ